MSLEKWLQSLICSKPFMGGLFAVRLGVARIPELRSRQLFSFVIVAHFLLFWFGDVVRRLMSEQTL